MYVIYICELYIYIFIHEECEEKEREKEEEEEEVKENQCYSWMNMLIDKSLIKYAQGRCLHTYEFLRLQALILCGRRFSVALVSVLGPQHGGLFRAFVFSIVLCLFVCLFV